MNKILLCIMAVLCVSRNYGQSLFPNLGSGGGKQVDSFNRLLMSKGKAVLDPRPFRRMTRNLYGYTLSGSNNPTSGVKVTTTTPSISYTGNVYATPVNIFSYEVVAGALDNIGQVFSNKKLNSAFKLNLGFNHLLANNFAMYDQDDIPSIIKRQRGFVTQKQQVYLSLDSAIILRHLLNDTLGDFDTLVRRILADVADYTLKARLYDYHVKQDLPFYDDSTYQRYQVAPLSPELAKSLKKLKENGDRMFMEIEQMAQRQFVEQIVCALTCQILNSLLKKPVDGGLPGETLLDYFKWDYGYDADNHYSVYVKAVDEAYQKVSSILETKKGVPKTLVGRLDDAEINLVDKFWDRKVIGWVNITGGIADNSITMFDKNIPAIGDRLFDTTALQLSLGVSYNRLAKYAAPNAFVYYNLSVGITGVNSINDISMKKFNYANNSIVDSSGAVQILSTKSGQAYIGNLKKGFGVKLSGELYYKRWPQPIIPGIYAKLEYNYGSVWVNTSVLTPSLGAILNVANADKTDSKNILTIIPYASYSSVLTTYSDVLKTTKDGLGNKFLFGIKVGVPIYY